MIPTHLQIQDSNLKSLPPSFIPAYYPIFQNNNILNVSSQSNLEQVIESPTISSENVYHVTNTSQQYGNLENNMSISIQSVQSHQPPQQTPVNSILI